MFTEGTSPTRDSFPSGSPRKNNSVFQFDVIESPRSPRRPQKSNPESVPFLFRVVPDSPSMAFSKSASVPESVPPSDEEEIVLPDFEVSSSSSIIQESPEPPNLGRLAKTAAVRILMNYSSADRQLKPLCDRIYMNFFRSFSEWNVSNAMKRRRKHSESTETITEDVVYTAREAYDNLRREAEKWARCDPSVPPFVAGPIDRGPPVQDYPDFGTEEVEDLIIGLDQLARDASRCMASALDVHDLTERIAEQMHAKISHNL